MAYKNPEDRRAYRRGWRARRKTLHLCRDCPRPITPDGTYCPTCLEGYAERLGVARQAGRNDIVEHFYGIDMGMRHNGTRSFQARGLQWARDGRG
jgi:hypothetical protein